MASRKITPDRLYQLSLRWPFLFPTLLLVLAAALRYVDVILLPLAERWGEAILHKALGLALVLAYLWAVRRPLAAIGVHGRLWGESMWIGMVGTALLLALGYGLQWAVSYLAGQEPTFVYAPLDSRTGLDGGTMFAVWLVVGNLVNASMEEGLFRGIMLPHCRRRLAPWQANLFQALLFGLWHLAWPARRWLTGQADLQTAGTEAAILVLGAIVSGLAYGYLFLKTGSLWAPWLAHAVNNTALNLLHIETAGGMDAQVSVLYGVIAVGYVGLMWWAGFWAKRLHMPELEPWGTESAPTPTLPR